MNDLVRRLLSGASVVTLQLCAVGAARASAGLTISGPQGSVVVTAAKTPDYIFVTSAADITGSLTNEGTVGLADDSIFVEGGAKITGSLVNAKTGVINATQVGIFVGSTAAIGGGITNAGKIEVQNFVTGRSAHDGGIISDAQANANVTNSGDLIVAASAHTRNQSAFARATGINIRQDASGAAANTLSNTGSITINAKAVNSALANSRSVVEVSAASALIENSQGGSSVANTLTNSGTIKMSAVAAATGATALARGFLEAGVYNVMGQVAEVAAAGPISQIMTNGQAITAKATAILISAGQSQNRVEAWVSNVFEQESNFGTTVAESLTNTGSVTIGVVAKAVGANPIAGSAQATATINHIVDQRAAAATNSASLSIANKGSVAATLTASAHGAADNYAHASARSVVFQAVNSATAPTSTVAENITNSGTIKLSLAAQGTGGDSATATAAFGSILKQSARGPIDISETLANAAPITLTGQANATVVAASASARASARLEQMFLQTAVQSGTAHRGNSATLAITNNSSLNVTLTAVAKGGLGQTADAKVQGVFSQIVRGYDVVGGTITNAADLTIVNKAVATGLSARAEAGVNAIFRQTAGQDTTAETSKSVAFSVSNTGSLSVSLTADAGNIDSGVSSSSGASAAVEFENVIAQNARAADDVTESFTNAAPITLTANANAMVANGSGPAHASAVLIDLFEQNAARAGTGHAGGSATLAITNNSSLNVTATAVAKGGSGQTAGAEVRGVFDQTVRGYDVAAGTITNVADLTIVNKVVATGLSARAEVLAANIFGQSARQSTDTNIGKSVAFSVSNTGSLSLSLTADATNIDASALSPGALAAASTQGIIVQRARAANDVTESITNFGSIALVASGDATQGFRNDARVAVSGAAILQSAEDSKTISQSFANSGTFSLALSAVSKATGAATAAIQAGSVVRQEETREVDGASSVQKITNSGSFSLAMTADAHAVGSVLASAYLNSAVFDQSARGEASAKQSITNSGSIVVKTSATATSSATGNTAGDVVSHASAGALFLQDSVAGGSGAANVASLSFANSGSIKQTARAAATGGTNAEARANAQGASQRLYSGNTGTATITNSGIVAVTLSANADGALSGYASVEPETWLEQDAEGIETASLTIDNANTISLAASAAAAGAQSAQAYATAHGIGQAASGGNSTTGMPGQVAKFSVTNSGLLSLSAVAKATAAAPYADAWATAVSQYAHLQRGEASFDNSGTIKVSALAATNASVAKQPNATATSARAVGLKVNAYGLSEVVRHNGSSQVLSAPAPLSVNITNSGTFSIAATAIGRSPSALARAMVISARSAVASSFNDSVFKTTEDYSDKGTAVTGSLNNSGSLIVSATAADGKAEAEGLRIETGTQGVAIANAAKGVIDVAAVGATAVAAGIQELNIAGQSHYAATRTSHSHSSRSGTRTQANITDPSTAVARGVTNDGTIRVSATGTVSAKADGISLNAMNVEADVLNAGDIDVAATGPGAIANAIHIFATRMATIARSRFQISSSGSQATALPVTATHSVVQGNKLKGNLTNTGTLNVTATGANAFAAGIDVVAGTVTGSIVNKGTINVTADGTGAVADGIVVATANAFTIANDGGIIQARVENGSATQFGNAIDVSAAPAAMIALNGGTIGGNIVESAGGNAIAVGAGNTLLQGVINPSKAKLGSLDVTANGMLTLASDAGLGAGAAYVKTFNQAGTLGFYATPNPGVSGAIHAGAATISGAMDVNLAPTQAPYALSTTYKLVFSDAALSGTWSSVDVLPDSAFFTAAGQYSANEADIVLTRLALNALPGLTPNEAGVGSALETIYDSSGTAGPLGKLLGALFNLTAPQYANALEALSGEPIGEFVNANSQSAQSFLDAIETHLGGDVTSGPQTTASLAAPSSSTMQVSALAPLGAASVQPAQLSDATVSNVWGGVIMSGSHTNATASGPGYKTDESGLIAGVDLPITPNLIAGVAGSYSAGGLNTDGQLGEGTFSAGQIAGYARYNNDNGLYASATLAYGDFKDKLSRFISIPGLGHGTATGKFTTDVFSAYGETGWHYDATGFATVTPYAALSYQNADAGGYTETGFLPLKIGSASSKATSSYIGLSLAKTWDDGTTTVTPHLKAAWQHDFTSDAWVMQAAFVAVPTAGFGLNGSGISRDSAYINGGLTLGIAENVDILLDYDGRFSSNQSESSFMARANFKF